MTDIKTRLELLLARTEEESDTLFLALLKADHEKELETNKKEKADPKRIKKLDEVRRKAFNKLYLWY